MPWAHSGGAGTNGGPQPPSNFLDLYRLYVGKSEVPDQYHLWCALCAIAAAVSNRVWLEKMPGQKLAPNLYVALLGPSAIGKNEAINAMLNVLRDQPRINIYKGKITAPGLLDVMASTKPSGVSWAHLMLVTPELSWSMGKGDWADALVKQLTEMYTQSEDPVREYTRTRATTLRIKDYCINWIAGSNLAWLLQSVPADNISGGFFGRIVAVDASYNFGLRYVRPEPHPEWPLLLAMLRVCTLVLSKVEGAFYETPDAFIIEKQWYNERPEPTDPDLYAAWKRQHDFLLKLAMLLALAEGPELTITAPIMSRAQKLSDSIVQKMPSLISYGAMTPETRGLNVAADFLMRCDGPVPHSKLMKHMSNRGYDKDSTRKSMETLYEMKRVAKSFDPAAKTVYWTWLGDTVKGNKYELDPPAS